jgi:hypothetical protein
LAASTIKSMVVVRRKDDFESIYYSINNKLSGSENEFIYENIRPSEAGGETVDKEQWLRLLYSRNRSEPTGIGMVLAQNI